MSVQDLAVRSTDCNSSTTSCRGEHCPGPLRYVVCQISQINCMRKGGDCQPLQGMYYSICQRCCYDYYILTCSKWFKMSPLKVQHGGLLLWCQNPELHSGGPGLHRKSSTLLTRYRCKEVLLRMALTLASRAGFFRGVFSR